MILQTRARGNRYRKEATWALHLRSDSLPRGYIVVDPVHAV